MGREHDSGGPPSPAQLKRRLLDANRRHADAAALNCAAHMILCVDEPAQMAAVGLEWLVARLGASRGDFGFATPADRVYRPAATWYSPEDGAPASCDTLYPNRAAVFRRTWAQPLPVSCDDVRTHPALADCRATYEAIGTRAIVFQRLADGRASLGLVSIDFTNDAHRWREDELRLLHEFCTTFLVPLAAVAQRWYLPGRPDPRRPTAAELAVIRLAAAGESSKRIAARLGKSIHTIENQLRSARQRLDAPSLAALVHRCEGWL